MLAEGTFFARDSSITNLVLSVVLQLYYALKKQELKSKLPRRNVQMSSDKPGIVIK